MSRARDLAHLLQINCLHFAAKCHKFFHVKEVAARSTSKSAVTLRFDAAKMRALQAFAAAENRTLTNFIETTLIRSLAAREEAARVITMRVAPGASASISPDDVVRGVDETDADYAARQDLMVKLWSLPDAG